MAVAKKNNWLERYKAGECAAVWAEMESLGADLAKPGNAKAAAAVVRETMARAQQNVLTLFQELQSLGYRFAGAPPSKTDYPLELRLGAAVDYARKHNSKKYKANPWAHPALAWVDEEEIELPDHFRKGRPARANYRPATARTAAALDDIERRIGQVLPLAIRGWFETVGSVDLKGSHPFLNPEGTITALRIVIEEVRDAAIAANGAANGAAAGAEFVAQIRHAFELAGLPGWSTRANPPQRELDWLRSKLLPL
jgi:hypothetical protein